MAAETLEELDAIIAREKERVTTEVFAEAWEELLGEGIEPTLVAEAAVHAIFEHLAREAGQAKAEALVEAVQQRVARGSYLPTTSVH